MNPRIDPMGIADMEKINTIKHRRILTKEPEAANHGTAGYLIKSIATVTPPPWKAR